MHRKGTTESHTEVRKESFPLNRGMPPDKSSQQYDDIDLNPSHGVFLPLEQDEPTGLPWLSSDAIVSRFPKKHAFVKQFFAIQGPPRIFLVEILASVSYGAIFGILPKIMIQRFAELNYGYDGKECSEYGNDEKKPEPCILGSTDSQDAHSFSELIANLLTFATSSAVGNFSDTHGRKQLFALATICALLGNFGFVYVYVVPQANPWVFYSLRSCHGLLSWSVIALASAVDVIPPQLRAPAVGIIMAAFLGGLCVGPIFAVVLGRTMAVLFSSAMALFAIIVAVFFVPETLRSEAKEEARRRNEQSRGDRGIIGEICFQISSPFQGLRILNRDSLFRVLSLLAFFNGMVGAGDKILLLYYVDSVLSFSDGDTAAMLLLYGVGVIIGQGVLMKPLTDRIGEKALIVTCFATAIFSNLMYGLATDRAGIFLGILLGAVSGMAFPSISAIQANNVDESEQGKVQGALFSMLAVATGVGPVVMRYVDTHARDWFWGPGTMFVFGALLQSIATILSCYLPKEKTESKYMARSVVQ